MRCRKAPGRAVVAGALLATVIFAGLLVANRAYYLRHARWTDFELSYATPTAGGEFVEAGSRLSLNPRIQTRIERRLSAAELAAIQAASRPLWGSGGGGNADWLARISTVDLLQETFPFRARVNVYLADPWLAERVARLVLDGVMQDATYERLDREGAEVLRLEQEIAANGGVASDEMKAKLRSLTIHMGISGLSYIRMLDQFPPRASAGGIVVWARLGEVAMVAAMVALPAGLLGMVATRIFSRRGQEKAAVLAGGGLG